MLLDADAIDRSDETLDGELVRLFGTLARWKLEDTGDWSDSAVAELARVRDVLVELNL
jgi:hypothetical protein